MKSGAAIAKNNLRQLQYSVILAEECYWQGTFLLQQRGGKEEVNELRVQARFFVFVSSALVLSPFSNLSLFFSLPLQVLQIV